MPKALTILGMIVASLVLLLFGADLAIKFPFQGASMTLDILFVLSALILAYLSWVAFSEQR